MIIRAIEAKDTPRLRKIYEEFYSDEFAFPRFDKNFICTFVIENDDNEIIVGGGVRLIAESMILTDKNFDAKIRRDALIEVLGISEFVCRSSGHNVLYAITRDGSWCRHLVKSGFQHQGNSLALLIE